MNDDRPDMSASLPRRTLSPSVAIYKSAKKRHDDFQLSTQSRRHQILWHSADRSATDCHVPDAAPHLCVAVALLAGARAVNLVAQALVEKAIAVVPHYGQALSLSAACHTFAAHMVRAECQRRNAQHRLRSAPTLRMRGALCAGERPSVQPPL